MLKRIVIIGGKLQGSEVAYLGKEAGFEVVLVDKDPYAPAKGLCDKFLCEDVLEESWPLKDLLKTADMILPTMENYEVLEFLVKLCNKMKIEKKLAFDWEAYKISCSKVVSDQMFHENNLPAPKYYPNGKYPYIAKPSNQSGSDGVMFLKSEDDLRKFAKCNRRDYIIQEFVSGPSYSVEIIGVPGNYRTYELTEIFVDQSYDCNSVSTLRNVDPSIDYEIRRIAIEIAELINLKGIMDLEVIVQDGIVKILEIDARFPSQTPIVVYHASGMNYVKELFDLFTTGYFQDALINTEKFASLVHYYVENGAYVSLGEHIMAEGGALRFTAGISKEAIVISDYIRGKISWRGTFIYSADTLEELSQRARMVTGELNTFLMLNNRVLNTPA